MINYTVGLLAHHEKLSAPILAKVFMKGKEGQSVTLSVEKAENMATLRKLGKKVISWADYQSRPCDPYDSIATARWAFSLFGLQIAGGAA